MKLTVQFAWACVLVLLVQLCGSYAEIVCQNRDYNSNNYRYVRTTVPNAVLVTYMNVTSQRSNSPCVLDTSYGSIGPDVFVDRGCRATFRICYEQGITRSIRCDSNNYREQRCNAGGIIRYLTLKNAPSTSPCIEGFSYYSQGNNVIVNKGCRATFLVGF